MLFYIRDKLFLLLIIIFGFSELLVVYKFQEKAYNYFKTVL